MQPIDMILIVFDLFTLFGLIVKPGFYWERGRIRRTRQVIGDKNTAIMYYIIGGIMLAVGIMGMMGMF